MRRFRRGPERAVRVFPWHGGFHLRLIAVLSVLLISQGWSAEKTGHHLASLERSYWLNASLSSPKRGYWGLSYPESLCPSDTEVTNACRLLTGDGGAGRLYLIYHHELPVEQAKKLFLSWRKACPEGVELVPTLVLRMYDKARTQVFNSEELGDLCAFFKSGLKVRYAAVYDVYSGRDQGAGLAVLAGHFPAALIRVGLQPDEPVAPPFSSAVADTWSGFCHGLSNADWQSPGFGEPTLHHWVEAKNKSAAPVAWDLVVVAWDYSNTKRGEYPGYDDANKNMPLPVRRIPLAIKSMLSAADSGKLAGFSSDLLILQLNSTSAAHDGAEGSFYETLKAGRPYKGYYSGPWGEVTAAYRALRNDHEPWRENLHK